MCYKTPSYMRARKRRQRESLSKMLIQEATELQELAEKDPADPFNRNMLDSIMRQLSTEEREILLQKERETLDGSD